MRLFLLLWSCFALSVSAVESLIPQLEKFRPFIGKTYRGEFSDSTPEKPIVDIARWQRHLNGTAIRIEHSLNQGEYGGETIIFFDRLKNQTRFYYFTTQGFYTAGTVEFDGHIFISHEIVHGNSESISEVSAKTWIQKDGSLKTESYYLKNGEWINGHSVVYTVAPNEKVIYQ